MKDLNNPHHLVLGKLKDFLTGALITDTYDERYRQKLAKMLVLDFGFDKKNIKKNIRMEVCAGGKKAVIKIDFTVSYHEKTMVLIKYAPGSLVTRRLSTLSLSRILEPYQIPVAVITNGEDAEIIEGNSGKVTGTGLENLPDKKKIVEMEEENKDTILFQPIHDHIFDQASRIAYSCEIDDACPCDSDICVID